MLLFLDSKKAVIFLFLTLYGTGINKFMEFFSIGELVYGHIYALMGDY